MKNGTLIAITGIDGSGKSTQIELLKNYFEQKGSKCKVIRIASRNTKEYTLLKNTNYRICNDIGIEVPLPIQAVIMAFANLMRIEYEIKEYLAKGYIVICDRFIESTRIYLEARNIDYHWAQYILESSDLIPDYYFMIDVPVSLAFNRINSRGEELSDHENIKTLETVRNKFLENKNKYNYEIILGDDSVDNIHNNILNKIGEC